MMRFLILIFLFTLKSSFAADPTFSLSDHCAIDEEDTTGLQSWMGCELTMTSKNGTRDMAGFINAYSQEMGLPRGVDSLKHIETKHGLASTHERYLQSYQELPIFGAWVSIHANGKGNVVAVHSKTYPEVMAGGSA